MCGAFVRARFCVVIRPGHIVNQSSSFTTTSSLTFLVCGHFFDLPTTFKHMATKDAPQTEDCANGDLSQDANIREPGHTIDVPVLFEAVRIVT